MSNWVRLTKTDNRAIDVNLDRAGTVLRDERNYSTLIVFGSAESVTVLETPDEIFGRAPKREGLKPPAMASI
jgi:hypothetical protein